MKTDWDYTDLAEAYLKRPAYAEAAIDEIVACDGVGPGARACDLGAGTGKLALPLLRRGLVVTAVEPNDAMRRLGIRETRGHPVTWVEGTIEHHGLPDGSFRLVSFGSSFPVIDRAVSVRQASRLLADGGWLAVVSNHRDLEDPLQQAIEAEIRAAIPDYGYGPRREDQASWIRASGLFGEVRTLERPVLHHQPIGDVVEAWRSHGTLFRQAGERFTHVVGRIEEVLRSAGQEIVTVPYTTRLWLAEVRRRDRSERLPHV